MTLKKPFYPLINTPFQRKQPEASAATTALGLERLIGCLSRLSPNNPSNSEKSFVQVWESEAVKSLGGVVSQWWSAFTASTFSVWGNFSLPSCASARLAVTPALTLAPR